MHAHGRKKEDISCRAGRLAFEFWKGHPELTMKGDIFSLDRNGVKVDVRSGEQLILEAGERVTISPGIYHAFWAESPEAVIGEISTANDDVNDNHFVDPAIGRFPVIEEDA